MNQNTNHYYTEISSTIDKCRHSVQRAVNDALVMLYWTIGKYLVCIVLENIKAEYGQKIVVTLSQQLTGAHFMELLPVEDETKRNSYAVMCSNENWSVRPL